MYCKLAFEVSIWCFYRRKIIRNVVAILLEKAFEICLFLIKEVCEQTTSFNYYKYGSFVASSLSLLFSKYAATFSASLKAG